MRRVRWVSHRAYPTSPWLDNPWTKYGGFGTLPYGEFPLPCLIGGCPSSESLSWGPQNSNFTMVYGKYIYTHLYFLWFINQRSHHWGAQPPFVGIFPHIALLYGTSSCSWNGHWLENPHHPTVHLCVSPRPSMEDSSALRPASGTAMAATKVSGRACGDLT